MFNGKVQAGTISTGLATTDDFLDQAHGGDSRQAWCQGEAQIDKMGWNRLLPKHSILMLFSSPLDKSGISVLLMLGFDFEFWATKIVL
jgi:hypothetical protein